MGWPLLFSKSLKKVLSTFFFFFTLLASASATAGDPALLRFQQLRTDLQLRKELQGIVEGAVLRAFGEGPKDPVGVSEFFQEPLPLFITFKKGEEVRGCMGSLYPRRGSLILEIEENLRRALFQDPRHREISREELPGMSVYLTAVGRPESVRDISEISPARDGAYLRSGSREAVALPGEAKTQRYLLVFLKAKAGVKEGEAFQLFRLPTLSVGLVLPPSFAEMGNTR